MKLSVGKMTTFQSASSRRLELPPSGGRESTFVVSQAYNQIEQVLIEENIKIPEGVWGKIVSCFINYYGKDAYINWISKLLVTENDKLVELTTNSEMVKDRIMAEYWAFLEEVSEAYDGWVVLR